MKSGGWSRRVRVWNGDHARVIERAMRGLPAVRGTRELLGDPLLLPIPSQPKRLETTVSVRCACGEHQRISASDWRTGKCGDTCKRCALEVMWAKWSLRRRALREMRRAS